MKALELFVTIFISIIISLNSLAQDKEVMKTLKKQFKKVEYCEDGYYKVCDKQSKKWGVAAQDGCIIVPCQASYDFYINTLNFNNRKYIVDGDNHELYDMHGNLLNNDWKSYYKNVEIIADNFIRATKGEYSDKSYIYYTIDFKYICDFTCKYVTSEIRYFGGSPFLYTEGSMQRNKYSEPEKHTTFYSPDGNIALKGYSLEEFNENGIDIIAVKDENNHKIAYYYDGQKFVPTFSEKVAKVKTIGGKSYYVYSEGLYNYDGTIAFPYYIIETTPHHFIIRDDKTNKFGIATHDFQIMVPARWDAISYHKSGKYSWFFATSTPYGANTWVKKHPADFPTNIIDLKGNSYSIPGKTSLEGVRSTDIKVVNGKLYVNKVAVQGLTPALLAYTPTSSGSTQSKEVPKAKQPVSKDFPSLEMVPGSLHFVDKSGRNTIEANGTYAIEFKVRNNGKGLAKGCVPKATLKSGGHGISIGNASQLSITPGGEASVKIPLSSSMNTVEGSAEFAVKVTEPSGFGTDELLLNVSTHAFVAPQVLVSDYTVTSATGSTLAKKIPFDLQLLIQNVKHGEAGDVEVNIIVPDNVYVIEGPKNSKITALAGGQTKDMVYTIVANNDYTSETIPVQVRLKEKYGKYAENRMIELKINQPLTASRITIDETTRKSQTEIAVARLNSDVDLDIPVSGRNDENTFAVIISNENYTQVAKVPHAANDGNIFEQYCIHTLGIPARNIRHVTDATLNDMKRQINWLSEIGAAFGNKAKLIFYYSGHGVPNEASGEAYILPVDGYHSDMETNYPVDDLYATLANTGAERVTVFMDACFSGARRGNGMLMAARGVQIKAKHNAPKGNMVIFSASQGDETAYPYASQNHGLFTYFLLKKIRETGGNVSLGELGDYITDNVKRTSLVENSKSQTPQVLVSPVIVSNWRQMNL